MHAAVRVEAHERKRLERLCFTITRAASTDERIEVDAAGQVQPALKTPWRDGPTHLLMSPLEFMQRLAARVPRPRLHLIRYHGVLAPNATLRARVVPQGLPALGHGATEVAARGECEVQTVQAWAYRIGWARLLKRVFDVDVQHCPRCGVGQVKIIAAILERAVIGKILTHLGLDLQPPPRGLARETGHRFWRIGDMRARSGPSAAASSRVGAGGASRSPSTSHRTRRPARERRGRNGHAERGERLQESAVVSTSGLRARRDALPG